MVSSAGFGTRTRFEDPCVGALKSLVGLLPRLEERPTEFMNSLAAWRSGFSMVLIVG